MRAATMSEKINERGQSAGAVMMIRPRAFRANAQTAATNAFQPLNPRLSEHEQQGRAAQEFDGLVAALEAAGVEVVVFDDSDERDTPDAVFPNNWVSFHGDGTVILYPMLAENRRDERRVELIDELADTHGFDVGRIIDLSRSETDGVYLEGTGSLVLDRVNRIAYACASPRTDPDLARRFCKRFGYRLVVFDAIGPDGDPVYHTNVLMSVGSRISVLCAESIRDDDERQVVMGEMQDAGQQVLQITREQMKQFAGNILELKGHDGRSVVAMSARALKCLSAVQRAAIEAHAEIVSAPIHTIEDCAGGSVRCMLAEIHLPKTSPR